MSGDVVPETRNWQASEAEPNESGGHFLSVSGETKLGNANEVPHLILADPPSPQPDVLLLELKVIPEGRSSFDWHWRRARLLQPVSQTQYAVVRVLWQGIEVAAVQVR